MKNIGQFVGDVPNKMIEEIQGQKLTIAGPQVWIYEGSDGNPDTEFSLELAIPVEKFGKDTKEFKFKELPEFQYVETTHNGPYSDFPEVYQNFIGEIMKTNLEIGTLSREVYLNCDFENQENCVTKIQIGIK